MQIPTEQIQENIDQKLIQQKNDAFNHLVNNDHELGNYNAKFNPLLNQVSTTGTAHFTHRNGSAAHGKFEVYINNDAVFAALYTDSKVKLLDYPFNDFLNIIKIMLLGK